MGGFKKALVHSLGYQNQTATEAINSMVLPSSLTDLGRGMNGYGQAPAQWQGSTTAAIAAEIRQQQLGALAQQQQYNNEWATALGATLVWVDESTSYPPKPKTFRAKSKTFREELQGEVNSWLSGI